MHDLQFGIGTNYRQCFDELKNSWFGNEKGLHIDSYVDLSVVSGYSIDPVQEQIKSNGEVKFCLFCVHLGGKIDGIFEEQHLTKFVVAKTEKAALLEVYRQAKALNFEDIHKDNLFEVERVINLSNQFNLVITRLDTNETYKVVNIYELIK